MLNQENLCVLFFAVIFQSNLVASDTVTRPEGMLPETGFSRAEFRSFDHMMQEFMVTHHVPGASLAVSRLGKLVYARGFGYANLGDKTPVEPDALLRIASISKPITAFAVLQLVQRQKIRLNDPVFAQLGLDVTAKDCDPRLKDVTVLQLLQHTGGWDRNESFDPMNSTTQSATMKLYELSYPFDPAYVVKYMLDKPLDFDPGTRKAYSNFGYCILGRLVEKASGQSYEEYVKQQVLKPLQIHRMRIGCSDRYEAAEVHYYNRVKDERDRFTSCSHVPVEIYESHGGWIASAIDLVRFGYENDEVTAQSRRGLRQLLTPALFQLMFARPNGAAGYDAAGEPTPAFYGCGWNVRARSTGRNIWHTGSLCGTSTLLVRRHDGLCWAVLFNTRESPDGDALSSLIDPLIHRAADAVERWPERLDLFRRYSRDR